MSVIMLSIALASPLFFYGFMNEVDWLAISMFITTIVSTIYGLYLEEEQENRIKKLEKMVNELITGKEE